MGGDPKLEQTLQVIIIRAPTLQLARASVLTTSISRLEGPALKTLVTRVQGRSLQ